MSRTSALPTPDVTLSERMKKLLAYYNADSIFHLGPFGEELVVTLASKNLSPEGAIRIRMPAGMYRGEKKDMEFRMESVIAQANKGEKPASALRKLFCGRETRKCMRQFNLVSPACVPNLAAVLTLSLCTAKADKTITFQNSRTGEWEELDLEDIMRKSSHRQPEWMRSK